jgi:hypothetical protein
MQAIARDEFKCELNSTRTKKGWVVVLLELENIIKQAPKIPRDMEFWRGVPIDYGDEGDIYTTDGFVSVSFSERVSRMFMKRKPCCLYKILVPKDSTALFIDDTRIKNKFGGEQEVVLPKGSKFKIIRKAQANNYGILQLLPLSQNRNMRLSRKLSPSKSLLKNNTP